MDTVQIQLRVGQSVATGLVSKEFAESLILASKDQCFRQALDLLRKEELEQCAAASLPAPLPTWYVVNRWGGAWPYADEDVASAGVRSRDTLDPSNAPHVVRRMVDAKPQEGA